LAEILNSRLFKNLLSIARSHQGLDKKRVFVDIVLASLMLLEISSSGDIVHVGEVIKNSFPINGSRLSFMQPLGGDWAMEFLSKVPGKYLERDTRIVKTITTGANSIPKKESEWQAITCEWETYLLENFSIPQAKVLSIHVKSVSPEFPVKSETLLAREATFTEPTEIDLDAKMKSGDFHAAYIHDDHMVLFATARSDICGILRCSVMADMPCDVPSPNSIVQKGIQLTANDDVGQTKVNPSSKSNAR
jgi:hypothetical protein